VFENFTYHMADENLICGLSQPKALDQVWKPFGALIEGTDDYRIVIREEEEL
jgi:hypothetical protein